jgi:hypothetical protein
MLLKIYSFIIIIIIIIIIINFLTIRNKSLGGGHVSNFFKISLNLQNLGIFIRNATPYTKTTHFDPPTFQTLDSSLLLNDNIFL